MGVSLEKSKLMVSPGPAALMAWRRLQSEAELEAFQSSSRRLFTVLVLA
jgi:hypothetical protein